jgi:hypothetical protein
MRTTFVKKFNYAFFPGFKAFVASGYQSFLAVTQPSTNRDQRFLTWESDSLSQPPSPPQTVADFSINVMVSTEVL